MKKAFCLVLIVGLLVIALSGILVSAETGTWKIGYSGQYIPDTQGVDGWYFMYSTRTNQGKDFPIDTFKPCVWDNKISNWRYYSRHSDGHVWSAPLEDIAKSNYDPNAPTPITNVWFQINCVDPDTDEDKDGKPDGYKGVRVDPQTWDKVADSQKTGLTGAIKWVAPDDGTYAMKVRYNAGSSCGDWYLQGWEYDSTFDGVRVSIYHDETQLYTRGFGFDPETDIDANSLPFHTVEETVVMDKGDALYFMTDPKTHSMHDTSMWTITLTKQAEATTTTTEATTSETTTEETTEQTTTKATTSEATTKETTKETTQEETTTTESTTEETTIEITTEATTTEATTTEQTTTELTTEATTTEATTAATAEATTTTEASTSEETTGTTAMTTTASDDTPDGSGRNSALIWVIAISLAGAAGTGAWYFLRSRAKKQAG